MRCAGLSFVILLSAVWPLCGQEKPSQEKKADEKKIDARQIDKQLYDVLKEVHNRGADIYNAGDTSGCYRLFQGSLETARALLAHRPDEQKFIDNALADSEKQASIVRRAFILHESIEQLRNRLRLAPGDRPAVSDPELLNIPPREPKLIPKAPPEPMPPPKPLLPMKDIEPKKDVKPDLKKTAIPKEGLSGHIFWKAKPLSGVEISFVPRNAAKARTYKTTSDSEGVYMFEWMEAGDYTVMLSKVHDNKSLLPERYSTAATSPLVVQIKRGDSLDFVLQ